MKCSRWFLCLMLLWAAPMASAIEKADTSEKVQIGDQSLQVPIAPGFVSVVGGEGEVEKKLRLKVPAGNRLLVVFAPKEDMERAAATQYAVMPRYASVQTPRMAEGRSMPLGDFQKIQQALERKSSQGVVVDPNGRTDMATLALQRIEEWKKRPNLKKGETSDLGVFGKTERSLDIAMVMAVPLTETKMELRFALASTLLVRGKVLFLYVFSNGSEEDIKWAAQTLSESRRAIFAANPE